MPAFVFEGTFTYIVDCDTFEEAEETMQEEMDSVLFDYRVTRSYE